MSVASGSTRISEIRERLPVGWTVFSRARPKPADVQRVELSRALVAGNGSRLEPNSAGTELAPCGGRIAGSLPADGAGGGGGNCGADHPDRKGGPTKSAGESAGAAQWVRRIEHGNTAARGL